MAFSYDSGEMAQVHEKFFNAQRNFLRIEENMKKSIDIIRSNWSGDEYDEKASTDLKAIEDALAKIQINFQEIIKTSNDIQSNMNGLKY